jgi:hypothetical protein
VKYDYSTVKTQVEDAIREWILISQGVRAYLAGQNVDQENIDEAMDVLNPHEGTRYYACLTGLGIKHRAALARCLDSQTYLQFQGTLGFNTSYEERQRAESIRRSQSVLLNEALLMGSKRGEYKALSQNARRRLRNAIVNDMFRMIWD